MFSCQEKWEITPTFLHTSKEPVAWLYVIFLVYDLKGSLQILLLQGDDSQCEDLNLQQ
jgi:hypothetical protein